MLAAGCVRLPTLSVDIPVSIPFQPLNDDPHTEAVFNQSNNSNELPTLHVGRAYRVTFKGLLTSPSGSKFPVFSQHLYACLRCLCHVQTHPTTDRQSEIKLRLPTLCNTTVVQTRRFWSTQTALCCRCPLLMPAFIFQRQSNARCALRCFTLLFCVAIRFTFD